MKLSQTLFVLPLLLAASITSCVDTGYYGGPRSSYGGASVGASRGYYTTLPSNYVGNAYYYNGRYYSGGNYQTGTYTYQGRTYNNRYYQNGQYLYGGVHQHHGPTSSRQHSSPTQQYQDRPDYRDSRDSRDGRGYSPRTDSRFVHPSRLRF
ncbi:MAG TPA: hypothetical protein DDZ88_29750 [Verrucomicrobiales bacterium]|nr:hypothetical protein [Verrucomicrobiales bacterium]